MHTEFNVLKEQSLDKPLLGLFAEDHLPVQMIAEGDREAELPDPSLLNHLHKYLGSVELPEPLACV